VTDFVDTKTCNKCGLAKLRSEFGERSSSKDGLRNTCKKCRAEYSSLYYTANKEACSVRSAIYREQNKENIKYNQKKYYKANRQRIIKRSNKHYQDNKPAKNAYYKKRRAENSLFRLRHNILVRINKGLKSAGVLKSQRSTEYLGCSWKELHEHIERQFLPRMAWDNRTEWHVDHIRPLASAKSLEELIPLLHFTNLRPLWAEDNMAKSDKIIYLI